MPNAISGGNIANRHAQVFPDEKVSANVLQTPPANILIWRHAKQAEESRFQTTTARANERTKLRHCDPLGERRIDRLASPTEHSHSMDAGFSYVRNSIVVQVATIIDAWIGIDPDQAIVSALGG